MTSPGTLSQDDDAPAPAGTASSPEQIRFSFRFRDRPVEAWTVDDGSGPELYVSYRIGVLPFSAESKDGRRSALMLLSRMGTLARSRLMLTDFRDVSIITKARLDEASSPVDLMSAAAATLMNNLPLAELVSDCLGTLQKDAG